MNTDILDYLITRRDFSVLCANTTLFADIILSKTIKELLENRAEILGANQYKETSLPENYQDYITPEDELVKKYANEMIFTWVSKKENPDDKERGVIRLNENLYFEEKKDLNEFLKKDGWQYPKDYLNNNAVGDCEDKAFAVASLFESKDYESRVVIGYFDELHMLVEVKINEKHYVINDAMNGLLIIDRRDYFEKLNKEQNKKWMPLFMFGKYTKFTKYNPMW